jgi:YD repeat-containing protein
MLSLFLGDFFANYSFAAKYSYDSRNRLTQVQYLSGATIQYSYDAMNNLLTVTTQGLHVPPTPPKIINILPGYQKATIYFSLSTPSNNAIIANYTATCSADGEITRTATGSGSPITVLALTINVQYTCKVTATDNAGYTSAASVTMTVTPITNTPDDDFDLLLWLPAILKASQNQDKYN